MGRAGEMNTSPAALKPEIRTTLQKYLATHALDVKAEIHSDRLKRKFNEKLAQVSPLPFSLKRVWVRQSNGKYDVEAELPPLPEPYGARLSQQVNELLNRSTYVKMFRRLSFTVIKSGVELVATEEDFELIKVTPEALDVEFPDLDEPFFERRIVRSARLGIDRRRNLLTTVRLMLKHGKHFTAKLDYTSVSVPSRESGIWLLKSVEVKQDAFVDAGPGGRLPAEFSVQFSNHEVKATPPVK